MPLAKGVPFVKPLKIYIYILKKLSARKTLASLGQLMGFHFLDTVNNENRPDFLLTSFKTLRPSQTHRSIL